MTCVRYAPPHSLWSFLHLSGIKSAQRCEMTQHFSWFSDAYITLDFLRSNKKPWIEMIYKLRHNIYFSAGLQAQISADIIRARLSLSTRRSFKVFQCPVGPWMTMMSCECGGSALHNTARRLICVTSIWGKRLLITIRDKMRRESECQKFVLRDKCCLAESTSAWWEGHLRF